MNGSLSKPSKDEFDVDISISQLDFTQVTDRNSLVFTFEARLSVGVFIAAIGLGFVALLVCYKRNDKFRDRFRRIFCCESNKIDMIVGEVVE